MTPRVAVVAPYYKESPEVLRACRDSVLQQSLPCTLFAVADGFPSEVFDNAGPLIRHVRLPLPNGDNGNTPRGVGSLLALADGFDFVAYLDADNWFHPTHIETLVELHERTQAMVMCSKRTFHGLDGTLLAVAESAEELHKHVDTSCYLLHRSCSDAMLIWAQMPKELSPACDRIFYQKIIYERYSMAFSDLRTCAFRSQYADHYTDAGLDAPPRSKNGRDVFENAIRYLLTERGASEAVRVLGFYPKPSSLLVG